MIFGATYVTRPLSCQTDVEKLPKGAASGGSASPCSVRSGDAGSFQKEASELDSPLPASDEPMWPRDRRAWLSLVGCFFLMFNSWGLVNAYGTFASYYMQHLLPGRDILLLNLVGSTESFIVLALSFVVGRILDAGYSRWLTGTGGVLVTVGMFMLSISNGNGQYNQGNYGLIWLTQGLITGLGMACFFVSSSQIAATWFIRRKSFAIGIVASGASISGLIYPVMTKFLITKVGFNKAVQFVSIVVCCTSFLSFVLATPNPAHKYRQPERWLNLRVWVDTAAFRNAAFCWFMAAIAFLFFGFYAIFFNLEEWAAAKGFGYKTDTPPGIDDIGLGYGEVRKDAIRTFYLLAVMNACSTIGRVGSAYLSDHFGALNVHLIATLLASLLVLLLWTLANSVAAAVSFVVVFGAVSGSVIGLPPASMAWILGPDPHQQAKLGQWTGMMYTGSAAFALTGPVIAGHLISEFKTYYTVQVWSGMSLFLSFVCMGAARYCARNGDQPGRFRRALSSAVTSLVEKIDEERVEKRRTVDEEKGGT